MWRRSDYMKRRPAVEEAWAIIEEITGPSMPFVWWQFPAGDDSDEAVRFAAAKAVYRDRLSVRFGLAMDGGVPPLV